MRLAFFAVFSSVLALSACGAHAPAAAPPAVLGGRAAPPAPVRPLTAADIDAEIRSAWQARGVTPSAPVDDATYLRRVHLDLVGVVPKPERVTEFLADRSPGKRGRLVAELLLSKAHADHMTVVWDDLLMGSARMGGLDRAGFRAWLRGEFEKNVPWDRFVYGLLTATGSQGESAATNYVVRFRDTPQDLAGSAAKAFLGTQIQCAQCHDHKTEKWKQEDFQRFAASFMRIQTDKSSTGGRFSVRDVERPLAKHARDPALAPLMTKEPQALDGTALKGNVRESVARWMIASPDFSRATVNRVWGQMLGRGFSDPVDDLRPTNPPELAPLLDRIAQDFVRNGHDLRRLYALVAATEVYQRGSSPRVGEIEGADIMLWSRFRAVPLRAEELANALLAVSGADVLLGKRADQDELRFKLTKLFSFTFDVDEESEQKRYEGTLAQALVLINGKLTALGSSATQKTPLAALARSGMTPSQKVDALFARILSRPPTDAERVALSAYLTAPPSRGGAFGVALPEAPPRAPDPKRRKGDVLARLPLAPAATSPELGALEDVAWALLNSTEFSLNF